MVDGNKYKLSTPAKVSLLYLVFSATYILFSDQLLSLIITNVEALTQIQTYKGLFFVSTTSLLLYLALARRFKKINLEIKQREESENKLLDHQLLLNTIIKNFPNAFIAIFDKDYILRLVSGEEFENQGIDPNYLLGQHFDEIHTADEQFLKKRYDKTFKGELQEFEENFRNRSLRYKTVPLYNHEGKIDNILIIAENITKRKKFEADLIDAKDKAERANNLKSEFLAQMSHEVRTPINTLLNIVQLLKVETEETIHEEIKELFSSADSAGKRIIRTIDLLLNMSELQTDSYDARFKVVNIYEEILLKLYREFKTVADSQNLKFLIRREAENCLLNVDQYSTEQIFVNLLSNAFKFTKNGEISIYVHEEGDNINVDIRDTGIGIENNFMEEMFLPFRQEEQGYTRKHEGNGLGLALVKEYCLINKAEISVESQKNEGTVFTVRFKKNSN